MARINRREMMQSGALASVFAASGGPVWAAGRRGGRLRAGLSGGARSDSWDMRTAPGLFMEVAGQGCVFDCLTEIGPDGALRGELAVSWESRDAQVWEIALRRDAVFHDGRAFTSADVVATFETHGRAPQMLGQVARIEARDAHGLRITLVAPNASFPYELAHPQLVIQPDGSYGAGIGTGLYQVQHFAPGSRLLAARVAEHWKGAGAGFADEVELLSLATQAEQRAALRAGVVDLVSDLATPIRGARLRHGAAMNARVQTPERVGQGALDGARFAERWWLA